MFGVFSINNKFMESPGHDSEPAGGSFDYSQIPHMFLDEIEKIMLIQTQELAKREPIHSMMKFHLQTKLNR